MGNICIVCGRRTRAKSGTHGQYCNRHAIQILRHGKTFKTKFEPNEIITDGDVSMMMIVSKNKTFYTLLDTDKVNDVLQYKWYLDSCGYPSNAKLKSRLHQFVLGRKNNMVIDHINHNKLDNRVCNLRHCSSSKNNLNRRNSIGVSWHKTAKKWRAYLTTNYKQTHLGLFESREKALLARREFFNQTLKNII